MSNNQDWEDDFDFDFEDEEVPQRTADNNSDLVKKLRKAERAKEKTIRELQEQLNSLKSQQREAVVGNFLAENGLNPKVAKFIPSDIDPTADSLRQWVNEYGDVFGLQPAQAPEVQQNLELMRQINAVTNGASTPVGLDDLNMRLDQATSAEEIINMIYSAER